MIVFSLKYFDINLIIEFIKKNNPTAANAIAKNSKVEIPCKKV